MILPTINLNLSNDLFGLPIIGQLEYKYAPFKNLQDTSQTNPLNSLMPLRLDIEKAGLSIDNPIPTIIEYDYDNSVNLILTDGKNTPKIVNSRFSLVDSTTYKIEDRKGNLDTNVYSKENFIVEANLIKSIRTITTIDFLGTFDGGSMKVGNYTFYFKLSDADGNESDFVAESGKVVCYIGSVNSPKSIRGGQLAENSNKVIKFRLNNLDLAYDYINIYYTKTTGDGTSSVTQAYYITDKFKITNKDTEISITGYENHAEIDTDSINIKYSTFNSVRSLANCQNMLFAGNISNNYDLYRTLEKYSLYLTASVKLDDKGIGYLDENYNELYPSSETGYEYYNPKNIYYKVGYWDEEIYRFGVVYILNDYTLSPVFNIRGTKEISSLTSYAQESFPVLGTDINYGDDYIIEKTNGLDNIKGVVKINSDEQTFNENDSIKPIGLYFKFNNDKDGVNPVDGNAYSIGLKDITKGFFIVRQKRIPTILAQGVTIATKDGFPVFKGYDNNVWGNALRSEYFAQSFLTSEVKNSLTVNRLSPSVFKIPSVVKNALLCPEVSVRRSTFNNFFNASPFLLKSTKFKSKNNGIFINKSFNGNYRNYALLSGFSNNATLSSKIASLVLVEPGVKGIQNESYTFRSQAGDQHAVYTHSDLIYGDYEDPNNNSSDVNLTNSPTKVRGYFNTFIGSSTVLDDTLYYNIFQKDYNFNNYWKDYFKIRYNDSSPFYPISDRLSWDNLTEYQTSTLFRGDCYINTFTQRMNWNFIDSEMPTNHRIVDPYTWYKNFKIINKASTVVSNNGNPNTSDLSYKKLLPLFTYKNIFVPEWKDDAYASALEIPSGLIEPDGKKFKKYSEANGLFGSEKINKPDINAVPLGYWVTVKVCSSYNLALRDIDMSYPMEEAVHKRKRSFYPFSQIDSSIALPESDVINSGISKTTSDKYYFEIPDVPYIQTIFSNRIHYSNVLQSSSFSNGNRIYQSKNYQDYTMEYGALVKIIEWYGKLIAIMEHGILMIPVNERAMMTNASGENVYINTDNVLPQNPTVLSNTFGSLWPDSIIKTSRYIYGIDTVAKKIWRTNGQSFENISDMKIQKFLNDKINLKESDKTELVNVNFIKTHYNAFKQDVIFVFKYKDVSWSLCWNELINKWVTQYTWFPEFSENINNIFYTFANNEKHSLAENKLFKHGFAGFEEELGNISPTKWYDEQQPFEFEFIVIGAQGIQKIFNNLKIISNMTEPDSFFFEVVGEGFAWNTDKEKIYGFTSNQNFLDYLSNNVSIKKLPFIKYQSFDVNDSTSFYKDRGEFNSSSKISDTRDITIREHNKTKEKLVNIYQKGLNIKKFGRIKGNMQYLEDAWDVQIQPITFKNVYLKNGELAFTGNEEMKIRDKYIKIRVKYDGKNYAIINALKSTFTISYA